jgi:alanine racemase
MGRAGIFWEEAADSLREIAALPNLKIVGLFTHFPLAYQQGSDFTRTQLARFKDILAVAEALKLPLRYIHSANSDAINNAPEACQAPFNLVRCGINLHGAFDAAGALRVPLRPVLTLTTKLTQVRTLPANTPIGYGHTYRTPRPMRIGTVCAGYADGLPLALSNRGHVLIRGVAAPILGRISMDYLTVSLENIPDATVGDAVTLLGQDGETEVRVQDWANIKGTHAYDIICSIGSRVLRTCK